MRRKHKFNYRVYDENIPGKWWNRQKGGWVDLEGGVTNAVFCHTIKRARIIAMRLKSIGGKPIIVRRFVGKNREQVFEWIG